MLAICGTSLISAQVVSGAACANIDASLSPRWTVLGRLAAGYDVGRESSFFERVGGGVRFYVIDSVYVSFAAQAASAQYVSVDNRDVLLSLSESVLWNRAHGFSYGLSFDQRRYRYRPSDYVASSSRFSVLASYARLVEGVDAKVGVSAMVVVNMQSELANARFVQRARLSLFGKRKVADRLDLGLRLEGFWGGRNQVYFADRHNLYMLSLTMDWHVKR